METDLQVLQDRIQTLEALLGAPAPPKSVCIHTRLKQAQEKLRVHVPDEMAAAKRAINMLTYATPSMTSLREVRKERAALAEELVDRAAVSLSELNSLKEDFTDASALAFDRSLGQKLKDVENTMITDVVPGMQKEEREVEQLLADFNSTIMQLNNRILALADEVTQLVE